MGGFYDLANGSPNVSTMGSAYGAFIPSDESFMSAIQRPSSFVVISESGDGISFYASRSNSVYGTQPTIMPASSDMLFGIYLGRPAKV